MEELYIVLYDNNDNEISYRVVRIFGMEGTEQLYCAAVPVDGGDIVFLRCALSENGEDTEVTISDIPNTAEYIRATTAYRKIATQEAAEEARELLSASGDLMTVTDADGVARDFIVHLIFEDEESGASYIAVQEVSETGEVLDEISLYRFDETDDSATIDMIPSDMEYERAKILFEKLIETT